MTLIIFIQCADAIIVALDRKESNTSDVGQYTKKYYLPTNHEFVLALAGESIRIDTIVSDLHIDQNVTAQTIREKLYEIIESSPQIGNIESMSSGLLLIKDGNTIQFNNVWFTNSQKIIVAEDPKFKCYGEGSTLADFLIRKFDFENYSSEVACQYLVAIFQEVAKRVDSVGSIENYGLDLLVLKNDGELKQSTIHDSDGIEGIDCRFSPKDDFDFNFSSSKIPKQSMSEKPKTETKQDTKSIQTNEQNFSINYQINGGEITSITTDENANSLLIDLNATQDGDLTITLPRALIDSRLDHHDSEFFVLLDGEETNFHETPTKDDRTITIVFEKNCKKIEIIGTDLFGKHEPATPFDESKKEFDAEKIHKLAVKRDAPIVVQTDKSVYTYGHDMIVTVINPYFVSGEPILLEIQNEDGDTVYKNTIPVSESAKGIYQEVIRVEGKDWSTPGSKYKIQAKYLNKEANLDVFTSDFKIIIELDQKVYSWRDKVYITVVAPELVKNPKAIEEIGSTEESVVTISTSQGQLKNYKLTETGQDTGIFVGEIHLTGFPYYDKLDVEKSAFGDTYCSGSTDGRISCLNKDGITVSLKTPTKTISASALIRWNIGEIYWLESSIPASGKGVVRVVDPDMNLDPDKIESFEIRVWSNTDPAGIKLPVTETEENSGIFKGTVAFTPDVLSESNKLRVAEGDTITAEYVDKTLPEPYSIKDELSITATTMIGTLVPPLQRVELSNPKITDQFGELLSEIKPNQEVLIGADVTNKQERTQKFAFIVQITTESGDEVASSWIAGELIQNQTLSPAIAWKTKTSGKFNVTIFVWEGISNPTALCPPTELDIVIGEVQKYDMKDSEKRQQFQERFPLKPKISVPKGSSVPGCEKDHKCYIPSEMIIRVNQTVVWNNDDTAAHTVTSGTPDGGPDGKFDSSLFMSGASFAHKFTKKGVYHYFCMVHPWQEGTVIVE